MVSSWTPSDVPVQYCAAPARGLILTLTRKRMFLCVAGINAVSPSGNGLNTFSTPLCLLSNSRVSLRSGAVRLLLYDQELSPQPRSIVRKLRSHPQTSVVRSSPSFRLRDLVQVQRRARAHASMHALSRGMAQLQSSGLFGQTLSVVPISLSLSRGQLHEPRRFSSPRPPSGLLLLLMRCENIRHIDPVSLGVSSSVCIYLRIFSSSLIRSFGSEPFCVSLSARRRGAR